MSLWAAFEAFADLLGPNVSFAGPDRRLDESKPSRISWEPVNAKLIPPRRLSGGAGDDGPILTRQWAILVQVWDVDLAATHALADKFLAKAHDLFSRHGFAPGEEEWVLGGASSKGVLCRMSFYLETPVLRTVQPTKPVTLNPIYKLNDTVV